MVTASPEHSQPEPGLEVRRVEWVAASSSEVSLRVLGHWSGKATRARPVLGVTTPDGVIEVKASEHGHPDGGEAEDWLATFMVPIELRSHLLQEMSLRIGDRKQMLPGAQTGGLSDEQLPSAKVIDRAVLAERRARRAELTEDNLKGRVAAAEAQAHNLERQLENLEQRLLDASDERDRLEAELSERERDLKATRQREYAEQQLRVESEDSLLETERQGRAEIERLKGLLAAAERHAADLSVQLEQVRREAAEAINRIREVEHDAMTRAKQALAEREEIVHQAEIELEERLATVQAAQEHVAALRDQLESRRGGLAARVGELRGHQEALEAKLEDEHRAREAVERELELELANRAADGERGAAAIAELERELQQRIGLQIQVQAELENLRTELEQVRRRADEEARRNDAAEAMLAELQDATAKLRAQVEVVEERKRIAEEIALSLRREVGARDEQIRLMGEESDRQASELGQVRAEAEMHARALEGAERTLESVRAESASIQQAIDIERRQHFEAEQQLRSELAREKRAFSDQLVQAESALHEQIAEQREHFELQVAAVQDTVAELRLHLQSASDQVERRSAAELEASARAEAVEREAAARIRDAQARAEQAQLAAEEAIRGAEAAAEQRLAQEGAGLDAVQRLRVELEQVRAEAEARAGREAELEALVAELGSHASVVADNFRRDLARLQDDVELRVRAEHDKYAHELTEVEARVTELREQLSAASARLRAELETEQAARWALEAELVAERERSLAEQAQTTELQLELERRAMGEARARADLRALQEDLAQRAEAESMARNELTQVQRELERAHVSAASGVAPSAAAQRLIDDLTEAVARLRARIPESEADPAPVYEAPARPAPAREPLVEMVETPAVAEPEPAAEPEPEAELVIEPEQAAAPEPPAPPPVPSPEPEPASEPTPAPRVEVAMSGLAGAPGHDLDALPTVGRRTRTLWLAASISRLAQIGQPRLAGRLILELLPVQAQLVRDEISYRLEIEELGPHLVTIGDGQISVVALDGEASDAEFAITGPAAKLASLVGGGASRRLPGTHLSGRRRGLRRLLRHLRQPVGLAELAAAGLDIAPGLIMTVLTAAVDPSWTRGHRFKVRYQVTGEQSQSVLVEVCDGDPIRVAVEPPQAESAPAAAPEPDNGGAATVTIGRDSLLAMLAGLPLSQARMPVVSGNDNAAAVLAEWYARAQGLSPSDS